MSWQLVSLDSVAATPWRNGGGVTRELVAWPSADDWTWRLSVADVGSNGPFSMFGGVDRWFAVLGGGGVRLDVEGRRHSLTRASAPFFFDGASSTGCELLDGATRDFNLMVQRSHHRSLMQRVEGHLATDIAASIKSPKTMAVYADGASARVMLDGEVMQLPLGTLAWQTLVKKASLHVEAYDALYVEICS